MTKTSEHPLAVVTGASTGIGLELAKCCAQNGFDLLIAADESEIHTASQALLDSFSFALRAELKDTGVTVTCLMPGATETEFFERADMMDTKVGTEKKQAADEVARLGFDAMMNGDGDVVAGWSNKLRAAIAHVMPSAMLAEQHRKMAAPGTAAKH